MFCPFELLHGLQVVECNRHSLNSIIIVLIRLAQIIILSDESLFSQRIHNKRVPILPCMSQLTRLALTYMYFSLQFDFLLLIFSFFRFSFVRSYVTILAQLLALV